MVALVAHSFVPKNHKSGYTYTIQNSYNSMSNNNYVPANDLFTVILIITYLFAAAINLPHIRLSKHAVE